jgi:hypothetical protein
MYVCMYYVTCDVMRFNENSEPIRAFQVQILKGNNLKPSDISRYSKGKGKGKFLPVLK